MTAQEGNTEIYLKLLYYNIVWLQYLQIFKTISHLLN